MNLFRGLIKTGREHIGVDIGFHSVKVAELSREKDIFKIINIGYAAVKRPNVTESIAEAVKEASAMAKVPEGSDVAIAVPSLAVVVRFIELPRMTQDELKNAIVFEAEKYIPFGINEVVIDHQLLIPHIGDNKMLVLLIAAKKDIVNERMELITQAGLSARLLDVSSLAGVNSFLASAGRNTNEISAVINIGAKATDINIVSENVLYFTRSVQIGGDEITKLLAESFSLSAKDAEELKINPKDKAAEVAEKVKTILNAIIDEIHLSFSYYENQSGRNIEKVYLGGGVAASANVCELMKENLDIDAVLWDPAGSMASGSLTDGKLLDSMRYQMGTAIGLALR